MPKINEILKKLEELENNKDRIEYLKKILDEIEDEDLINEIKGLIKELEEDLESKLENVEIPTARKAIREIDLDEVEQDVEQVQRNISQRNIARPDLAIRQSEDEDLSFSYSSNNNYSNTQLYAPQLFNYQELQSSFSMNTVEQNLVRENILNPESSINEVEKENLSRRLHESMPGKSEEELFMYKNRISEDLKKDEKAKYIARLK